MGGIGKTVASGRTRRALGGLAQWWPAGPLPIVRDLESISSNPRGRHTETGAGALTSVVEQRHYYVDVAAFADGAEDGCALPCG